MSVPTLSPFLNIYTTIKSLFCSKCNKPSLLMFAHRRSFLAAARSHRQSTAVSLTPASRNICIGPAIQLLQADDPKILHDIY